MTTYSVTDFGAIGDGNVANASANTIAFTKVIAAAANPSSPGIIYVPISKGFCVNNGVLKIPVPNMAIRGEASMGSNPDWGLTSTIIGHGPGHTLQVPQGGGVVERLVFKSFAPGEQKGGDAFLLVSGNLVTLRDLHLMSPNAGISLSLPPLADGEFWVENVLIDGTVGVAGIAANIGNAALYIRHAIMDSLDPQPPYGIVVTSCGELILSDSDIINMGTCLALVPGAGGAKGQHVIAVLVSNSLFDGGNGPGCVYVAPSSDAFVATAKFSNCWASTFNNGNGTFPTNGFMFDGSQAHPVLSGVVPIQDVSLSNCNAQNFRGHSGLYARGVKDLSVMASHMGANNFDGMRIAAGCSGIIMGNRCGGNADWGIIVEHGSNMLIPTGTNTADGNGVGGIIVLP